MISASNWISLERIVQKNIYKQSPANYLAFGSNQLLWHYLLLQCSYKTTDSYFSMRTYKTLLFLSNQKHRLPEADPPLLGLKFAIPRLEKNILINIWTFYTFQKFTYFLPDCDRKWPKRWEQLAQVALWTHCSVVSVSQPWISIIWATTNNWKRNECG